MFDDIMDNQKIINYELIHKRMKEIDVMCNKKLDKRFDKIEKMVNTSNKDINKDNNEIINEENDEIINKDINKDINEIINEENDEIINKDVNEIINEENDETINEESDKDNNEENYGIINEEENKIAPNQIKKLNNLQEKFDKNKKNQNKLALTHEDIHEENIDKKISDYVKKPNFLIK